jgi:hypothetical protein
VTTTNDPSVTAPPTQTSATEPQSQRRYRWQSGDCLKNYGISANIWEAHSSTEEFSAAFMAIIDDKELTNDERAAQVELFLLDQATTAGVVDVSSTNCQFANPNKWDKHLAPWFTEQCTTTRRTFRTLQRKFGRKHTQTIVALKTFADTCKSSRAQM